MIRFLTRTSVLWGLAGLVFVISCSFAFIMHKYGFLLIDEMWDPEKIHQHIEQLTPLQQNAHIWTTATLDVAFPFAYGGLFAGLVWRFFGKSGRLLAMPGLAAIPVDLAEGAVQIMALNGNTEVVFHKLWVTPIKLGLFVTAASFALIAIGVALWRKIMSPEAS